MQYQEAFVQRFETDAACGNHPGMIRNILFLSLFAAASGAAAQPVSIAPGEGFQVERYAVELRRDRQTIAVSGTETIVVQSTSEGLEQLAFTPNALRIAGASVDGSSVPVASAEDAIVFTLPRALSDGQKVTLRFRFDGTPAKGLTVTPAGIYASYFACDWMVCLQNSPGDKADFALDLFLPAGSSSVGVGRALKTIALPDDLELHRWRSTRPYSPYLYAFAAGAFDHEAAATEVGELDYYNATGNEADLPTLFAQTPAIAAFFADKAGMDLPGRRYGQVLVPDHEAQETVSFSLIGKGELDRERDDPSSAWVIAHEMAHQYWGNLVTCATWQDFWLNEGIATFMVAAWEQHNSGEDAYQQELDVARHRVDQVRKLGFDKPLAWAGKYPSLGVRRAVQYSKGALFVAHLREDIGDDAFWDGLRRFTREHSGGTVTSKDFQNAMEAASDRDLSPMFAEWVYGE